MMRDSRLMCLCMSVVWMYQAVFSAAAVADPAISPRRVVGYYAASGIYDARYPVSMIPAGQITHVNYAFAKISHDGRCLPADPHADVIHRAELDWDAPRPGSLGQLMVLKKRFPRLKTLISVGGPRHSEHFSQVASSPTNRNRFAQSCIKYMLNYNMDGVDIDWEFPVISGDADSKTQSEDRRNLILLLRVLRAELDRQATQDQCAYLLTAAIPAVPEYRKSFDLGAVHPLVDWMNVMTCDMNSQLSTTCFHAPLYATKTTPGAPQDRNVDATVKAILEEGVPADKIVLGIPFYGRGYRGVAAHRHGLGLRYQGAARGDSHDGLFDYRTLRGNYLNRYPKYWHKESKAAWLYEPERQLMITFEEPRSVRAKTEYVIDRGLGGVAVWELSMDTRDGRGLLFTISESLKSGESR